ncbi:MAG TPA: serine/threonine-protein kinase [Gemmatimonadaceae bacterium]
MTTLSHAAVARLRRLIDEAPAESRYEILETLGEGGMGTVYLAHDRELERDVALKVLRAAAPSSDDRERILREARILASLEHPGIVPVHDVGVLQDGRLFYVMKRVKGERFDQFVHGEHSRTELLRALLQVCDAISFAHAAGVVHRDLKPQNIMLGAFGEVLVLDWGVAKWQRELAGPDNANTVAGTPGYMAPEQLHGVVDSRSDVFGLGGILFFLLTGQHPSSSIATDGEWREEQSIPTALRAICERSRADNPANRYPTAQAMASDIINFLDALPIAAHTESLVERLARVASRHRTAILLVLAYLVMRVALLIFTRR